MAFERILVVEDDPQLASMVCHTLQTKYQAVVASTGQDALFFAETEYFDLILLDLNLPDMDGLVVAEQLQGRTEADILMLTARGDVQSRVAGLYAGASDYLSKPFHTQELLARVHAQLRKRSGSDVIDCGTLTLDLNAKTCRVAGQPLELSGHEFRLLALFLSNKGRVFSRSDIESRIYHDLGPSSNTIEVFISKLRSKLADAGVTDLIQTIRGLGYVIR